MTAPADTPLDGRRVLIVEDRYLIAREMADEVVKMGGTVLGPCRDLASAADCSARHPVDLALLDVNLNGEMIYPLAEALADKGVPFIFLTGYDADIVLPEWRERPRLPKPVDRRALRKEISKLLAPPTPETRR